jgi:hypothetical protein
LKDDLFGTSFVLKENVKYVGNGELDPVKVFESIIMGMLFHDRYCVDYSEEKNKRSNPIAKQSSQDV